MVSKNPRYPLQIQRFPVSVLPIRAIPAKTLSVLQVSVGKEWYEPALDLLRFLDTEYSRQAALRGLANQRWFDFAAKNEFREKAVTHAMRFSRRFVSTQCLKELAVLLFALKPNGKLYTFGAYVQPGKYWKQLDIVAKLLELPAERQVLRDMLDLFDCYLERAKIVNGKRPYRGNWIPNEPDLEEDSKELGEVDVSRFAVWRDYALLSKKVGLSFEELVDRVLAILAQWNWLDQGLFLGNFFHPSVYTEVSQIETVSVPTMALHQFLGLKPETELTDGAVPGGWRLSYEHRARGGTPKEVEVIWANGTYRTVSRDIFRGEFAYCWYSHLAIAVTHETLARFRYLWSTPDLYTKKIAPPLELFKQYGVSRDLWDNEGKPCSIQARKVRWGGYN